MKITTPRRCGAVLLAGALAVAACGSGAADDAAEDVAEDVSEVVTTTAEADETTTVPDDEEETTTTEAEIAVEAYPVELEAPNGVVTVAAMPQRIVSLSPSTTEMLFAIGAGGQVEAVDSFSTYPADAPVTDLSAFEPNFEAIAAFEPDLVITSFDLENSLTDAFAAIDVPVLVQSSALTIDDTYAQIADLGVITGNIDEAAAVNADVRTRVQAAIAGSMANASGDPVRVYHELDDTFFSISSASFIGDIYAKLGFENVADEADPDGFGYPQVTPEYLIAADPTLIVITDQVGYTVDDVAARPGWDSMTAVQSGNVVQIDADIASRWGPRVADLAERLAELSAPATTG